MNALTWEDILSDQSLQDLPYKIETNRHHQIIMSPAAFWHGEFQCVISALLSSLRPGGTVTVECPIQTAEGVRVPDVVWISKARRAPHRRANALPVAPEICVEVLSPSNTREQMLEKMTLYYAKGAQEVWLCDPDGNMEFFTASSAPASVLTSELCPDFPQRIEVD